MGGSVFVQHTKHTRRGAQNTCKSEWDIRHDMRRQSAMSMFECAYVCAFVRFIWFGEISIYICMHIESSRRGALPRSTPAPLCHQSVFVSFVVVVAPARRSSENENVKKRRTRSLRIYLVSRSRSWIVDVFSHSRRDAPWSVSFGLLSVCLCFLWVGIVTWTGLCIYAQRVRESTYIYRTSK